MKYSKSYLLKARILCNLGMSPDNKQFAELLNARAEVFNKWVEEHGGKVIRHTDKVELQGANIVSVLWDEI